MQEREREGGNQEELVRTQLVLTFLQSYMLLYKLQKFAGSVHITYTIYEEEILNLAVR